jgi:class 3 adenylate cyclase/tetratricopeptide (TPR) repeat protein
MDRSTSAQREARKTVSVLFCDVRGSTSLGERLDPESLRHVMDRYFERMETVITAHGGTVEKFIGDAVMAVFGIPVLHEDDALRAVRAAAEMRDTLAELNEELRERWGVELTNRIGVNTGEVVAGDAEAGRTLVTGDPVNTAARLEQAADPGEILIGAETYQLTRHAVVAQPLDPLALRGKAAAVEAFRLLEVEGGLQRAPMRIDSPMVGRERQLRLLRDAYEEAVADRACYLVTVLGPAGIGKSRLALEFLGHTDEATVLTGRCLPYGEGITFWPVAEMVRGAARIGEQDPPERAKARILDLLEGAEDREVVAMHLARLMGLDEGPRAEPGWALRRLLETLAVRAPVITVFDDVHWAEPALVEAIEHVTDLSRDAPILLLCLARPELLDDRPGWGGGRSRVASILLEPLGEADARTLLENLVGGDVVEDEIVERISDTARGHPLFVEQMLSTLLETGAIGRKEDRWVTIGDLATVSTPAAISALLSARLDRLSDDERVVVSSAAVVGEVFERGAVEALAPEPLRPSVGDRLRELLRKDLIRPAPADAGGEAFRFRHILVRDAAYEALAKHDRADLHEALAGWIERTSGSRLAEVEEIVGYHLEQAYRYREELGPVDEAARELAARAAARLASAGRRVRVARWDVDATINLLTRARDLAPAGNATRLEIDPDLAGALMEKGNLAEASRVAEEAVRGAEQAGDNLAVVRARVASWHARARSDPALDLGRIEAIADEAIELLEARGDGLGAARAWLLKAEVRWSLTDYGGRIAACERAAEHARSVGAGWEEAEALGNVAWGLLVGEVPVDSGRRRIQVILDEARANGNRMLEADALATLGGLAAASADLPMTIGDYEWLAGNLERAERALREAYEGLGGLGETTIRSTCAALLAVVHADLGELDAALGYADEAMAMGGTSDLANVVLTGIARAKVLSASGRAEEAIGEAERAVAAADAGDDLSGQSVARLTYVASLHTAGRNEEAAGAAREALDRSERKGSTVLANRARALLAQIGS